MKKLLLVVVMMSVCPVLLSGQSGGTLVAPATNQTPAQLRTLTLNLADPVENMIFDILRYYKTGKYADVLALLPYLRARVDARVVKPKYERVESLIRLRALIDQYAGRKIEMRLRFWSLSSSQDGNYLHMFNMSDQGIYVFYPVNMAEQVASLTQQWYIIRGEVGRDRGGDTIITMESIMPSAELY